ncbi:MAG: CBASS cGAMP-activated phospholipase [Elusimicrobia bacterium]|nr:CBASS cGAMP-activated phospholipase [Elusimicrobiota bacterium]
MKRILTLDGGGIKGTFAVAFLAALEEDLGVPIGRYFDLIAGTSTGGIIALGLGLGYSAQDMLNFYLQLGPKVFASGGWIKFLKHIGWSKYSPKPLESILREKFGARVLGESKTRLVIPSVNLENGEVYIYKTSHHPRLTTDWRKSVVEIALATGAAPTYFPTHRSEMGTPLVDGGIWANNPVGLAVVEGIGVLGWERSELRVLSVGCTYTPLNIEKARDKSCGRLYWAFKLADLFMSSQSSGSCGTASVLCPDPNNQLFRYNPPAPENRFSLDGIKEIDSLRGLGHSEARKVKPRLQPVFFTKQADTFSPIHTGINAENDRMKSIMPDSEEPGRKS